MSRISALCLLLVACDPEGLGRPNPDFHVIGHRGAPLTVAENTIPSFEVATALGANAIETDVCVTKDGVFVLWHDRDPDDVVALARQSGVEGQALIPLVPAIGSEFRRPVEELTLDELREHYGYGDVSGNRHELAVIPTFDELLLWAAPHEDLVAVYLDIKLTPAQLEATTMLMTSLQAALEADAALARVRFFALSIEPAVVDTMASSASDSIRVVRDTEGLGGLDNARKHGLRDVSVGIVPSVSFGDFKEEVAAAVTAREKGSIDSVVVWTFERKTQLAELLYYSVDGVMTDDPATLYEVWQDSLD
jgi:glycerophosphoryl diester phosphodiesterase